MTSYCFLQNLGLLYSDDQRKRSNSSWADVLPGQGPSLGYSALFMMPLFYANSKTVSDETGTVLLILNWNSYNNRKSKIGPYTEAAIPSMVQVKTYSWHDEFKLPGAENWMNVQTKHEGGRLIGLENNPSAFSSGSSFSFVLNVILSSVSTVLLKQIALGSRHPLSQPLLDALQRITARLLPVQKQQCRKGNNAHF